MRFARLPFNSRIKIKIIRNLRINSLNKNIPCRWKKFASTWKIYPEWVKWEERERKREKENSRTFGDRRISGKEDIDAIHAKLEILRRRGRRGWGETGEATNEAQLANETALESKGHRPDNLPTNLAN